MSYLLYVLGAAIIIVTLIDIIWTTLWVDGGAGWITDRLTTGIWRRILKSGKENLMNISGPLILTVTLFTWFFLLWFGATVFFAGDLGAIVHSSSSQSIHYLVSITVLQRLCGVYIRDRRLYTSNHFFSNNYRFIFRNRHVDAHSWGLLYPFYCQCSG